MASFDFSLSHPASLVKSGLKFHKRTSLINGWHHGGYIHPLHADLAEPIVNTKLNIYLKRNVSHTQTNQRSNSNTKEMEHRNVKKKKGANGLQEGNLDLIPRHKNSILRSKTTKQNAEINFYYISNVK